MDPFSKQNLDPLRSLQQKSPKRQSNDISQVAKYSNIALKNRRSYATLVDLISNKKSNMHKSASHKLLPNAKDLQTLDPSSNSEFKEKNQITPAFGESKHNE